MGSTGMNKYDETYYKSHCGEEYERGHGWEEVFGNYADRVVREIQPKRTLDIGCARGFFVEALCDRGVDAYGIDISEYAISNVREDMRSRCKVQSALVKIEEKYDLITCIEVLEHLDNKDIPVAIQRMCEATDDIIFSSTPFDYDEESHISIHTPEYWVEQFAYNGFYHDVGYDCSYIAVQTMRFRRVEKSKVDLIREYERELFQKHQEVVAVRQQYKLSEENVEIYKEAYQKHVDMINQELNPKINELNLKIANSEEKFSIQLAEARRKQEEETEEIKKEIEIRCHHKVEEEVRLRKGKEELYYFEKKLRQETEKKYDEIKRMAGLIQIENEQIQIENEQMRVTNKILQDELQSVLEDGYVGIKRSIKQRRKKNAVDRELRKKSKEYWKPVFDADYYTEHNRDIYDAFGNDEKKLLKHFIFYGMGEGRRANEEFDLYAYMLFNPDIVKVCKMDKRAYYLHYIKNGRSEKRRTK